VVSGGRHGFPIFPTFSHPFQPGAGANQMNPVKGAPEPGELELEGLQAGEALDNARSDLHGAVYPATHPSQRERWLDAQSSERNFVHLATFFSCLDVWQDGWEKDR